MTQKIHLVSISSDIYEDSYEEGELDSTGCGLDERIGKTFDSKEDALKWLSRHYNVPRRDWEEHWNSFQTDRACADHTEEQNGGWMDPTEEELESWKRGETELYVEHFTAEFITICESCGAGES